MLRGILAMGATKTRGIVRVGVVTGRTIGTTVLAIRTHFSDTARGTHFVGGHVLTRVTSGAKR